MIAVTAGARSVWRAVLGVLVATGVGMLFAGAAAAESVPVSSAGGTFNSTSESGTGRLTSNASATGLGAMPSGERRDQVIADNFGRVNAGLSVKGGRSYRVTTTLDGAITSESQTGQATARGFVEVQLYSCCFAGETTFLTKKEAELPTARGRVQVIQEVYVPQDTTLTPNVLLHSRATAFTDTRDTARVDSSAAKTRIDITPSDEVTEPPVAEPEQPGRKPSLVGSLLGGVGKVLGMRHQKRQGTATVAVRMSEPGKVSLGRTARVRSASKVVRRAGTVRVKVRPRKGVLRKLRARARAGKRSASVRVTLRLKCDPKQGRAYAIRRTARLVLAR